MFTGERLDLAFCFVLFFLSFLKTKQRITVVLGFELTKVAVRCPLHS